MDELFVVGHRTTSTSDIFNQRAKTCSSKYKNNIHSFALPSPDIMFSFLLIHIRIEALILSPITRQITRQNMYHLTSFAVLKIVCKQDGHIVHKQLAYKLRHHYQKISLGRRPHLCRGPTSA